LRVTSFAEEGKGSSKTRTIKYYPGPETGTSSQSLKKPTTADIATYLRVIKDHGRGATLGKGLSEGLRCIKMPKSNGVCAHFTHFDCIELPNVASAYITVEPFPKDTVGGKKCEIPQS
jgi:hypothetical protein